MIARVGGDEFVILLDDVVGTMTAELIANRITQLTIDPITYQQHTLSVSVSIGISLFPEDGVTEDEY